MPTIHGSAFNVTVLPNDKSKTEGLEHMPTIQGSSFQCPLKDKSRTEGLKHNMPASTHGGSNGDKALEHPLV